MHIHIGGRGARREKGADRTDEKEGKSIHIETQKIPKTNFLDFPIWLRVGFLVHFFLL